MPKVFFKQEKIEATYKNPDSGLYKLKLLGFKPTKSEKGDSINFNPILELVGTTDGSAVPKNDDGSNLQSSYWGMLNSKADGIINDFCHAFGLPMEGTPDALEIPGIFDGPAFEAAAPKALLNWNYKGPLVNRICTAYLEKGQYKGKDNVKIKYYQCVVPDCTTRYPKVRHSTDLNKQK